MDLNFNLPSPIHRVRSSFFGANEIFIKREDLIHPVISGNKFRKLKYNLIHAKEQGYQQLLSFGGAFSNHLAAFAFAGQAAGFETIGVIRGELDKENPSIQKLMEWEMTLEFVSRTAYKQDNREDLTLEFQRKYPKALIIPEGGTNTLALHGMQELMEEIEVQMEHLPDIIAVAFGSGGTSAGILQHSTSESDHFVFSSFKGKGQIDNFNLLLSKLGVTKPAPFRYIDAFHFGGYARFNATLLSFIHQWEEETEIPLDPIYTAKLCFGLNELIAQENISGKRILIIHTGGLQGREGFQYLHGDILTGKG